MEIFLLGVSLGALSIWTASLVIPAAWERWASETFDEQIHNRGHLRSIPTNTVVGRLTIPRLNLTAMVREGDKETTLSLALGHIPGTALPGQNGNVGVAGHRDALFRGLRNVKKDDVIRFETVRGDYLYQVEETEIVKPEEVSVLKPGPHSELTLVTCYPFYFVGSAPDRFIVKARAITSAPAPKSYPHSGNPPEPSL
jgi:LPXTG-site transpeptidase (sortase) family protein